MVSWEVALRLWVPMAGRESWGSLPAPPSSKGRYNGPSPTWAENPRAGASTGSTRGARVGGHGEGGSWSNRSIFEGSWRIDFFSGLDPSSHASFFLMARTCEVGLRERKVFIYESGGGSLDSSGLYIRHSGCPRDPGLKTFSSIQVEGPHGWPPCTIWRNRE